MKKQGKLDFLKNEKLRDFLFYEEQNKGFLLKGKVEDILSYFPNNSVDLGITSPPYNKKEKNKGWLLDKIKYDKYRDNLPEDKYQESQVRVLNELYRIIKPGGSFFYNHKIRWEKGVMIHPMDWLRKTEWTIRQEIIWNRKITPNIRGWRFWQVEERIYWLYKPEGKSLVGKELKSKHALLTSIWQIFPERNNPHPAPFPIEIPTRIIYSITDEEKEKIIIDPYCGSGTTLVSAKILGHFYIGIDVSENYLNFTIERLQKYLEEKQKVEEEKNKHSVRKTFKERKEEGKSIGKYAPKKFKFTP